MNKKIIWIVVGACVLVLLILCLIPISKIAFFIYASTWKYCADFENYKAEFVLVKDYVEAYMGENTGTLSVGYYAGEHPYDLYDPRTGQYLDCPPDVRQALRVICYSGFPCKDSQFEYISRDKNAVTFHIISGPYRLVYSPEKKPTIETHSWNEMVVRKKIKDGWYHVTLVSW